MPVRERATVTPDGKRIQALPEGAFVRDLITHVDRRGSICELIDPRWEEIGAALTYAYFFSIRPGVIKGWALHEEKADRYALLTGEIEVVLYDPREGSSTQGLVTQLVLNDLRRQMLQIPPGVWHALHGLGTVDGTLVNFPTTPYRHDAPDKIGLPLDNDVIPFRFAPPTP